MMDHKRLTRVERWLLIGVVFFLAACEATTNAASSPLTNVSALSTLAAPPLPTRTALPTIVPTATAIPPTATPSPTLVPTVVAMTSDGWQLIRSGVYLREMQADPIGKTGHVDVVKIDPAQVDLHVRYQPSSPLKVHEWYSTTQALVVINSSFFDSAHNAVGQLTSDGQSGGQAHQLMEGAFYLTGAGAAVWPLRGWTKPAGLHVMESVESFPMLLLPGGILNPAIPDDARTARRTVVAVDRSGNLLFIVTPSSAFTLHGMAVWLANSDLDIDTALNFDGGSSSGIAAWTPTGVWGFDSVGRVPAVVTVDVKVLGTIGPDDGEGP
ncbi:MAG TPA: phosphodiester glycosidase family protein [Anaerolineae bacterium]|nr:phosphodiester glycosidase family protein [Anaerolineae bacterium]